MNHQEDEIEFVMDDGAIFLMGMFTFTLMPHHKSPPQRGRHTCLKCGVSTDGIPKKAGCQVWRCPICRTLLDPLTLNRGVNHGFKELDLVVFESVVGSFKTEGIVARIFEIKTGLSDTETFPHGIAFGIEFQDPKDHNSYLYKTHCRVDELTPYRYKKV